MIMTKDDSFTTEIDRIVHFLEYEVNLRYTQEKIPGWTTWAILGTLASLLWLLFSLLATNKSLSWYNILYITLLLSISSYFFYFLLSIFPSAGSKISLKDSRFKYFDNYGGIFLFLTFSFGIGLMMLLYWFSPILFFIIEFSCTIFIVIGDVLHICIF